jgi:hypothetical protein
VRTTATYSRASLRRSPKQKLHTCNLPYDFGKIMGGVGSGNWYRFYKKTTTGEYQSIDVRHLHRESACSARERVR